MINKDTIDKMVKRILGGDTTINVCDIIKYIKENKDETGYNKLDT